MNLSYCSIYLDDIINFSMTLAEQMEKAASLWYNDLKLEIKSEFVDFGFLRGLCSIGEKDPN